MVCIEYSTTQSQRAECHSNGQLCACLFSS
nr:MAG TPA: hypothetical protein [Caudoviricetes sp.]